MSRKRRAKLGFLVADDYGLNNGINHIESTKLQMQFNRSRRGIWKDLLVVGPLNSTKFHHVCLAIRCKRPVVGFVLYAPIPGTLNYQS